MNAQLNTMKRWRHRSTSQDDIYATYIVVLSRIHMQKLSMQRNRTAQLYISSASVGWDGLVQTVRSPVEELRILQDSKRAVGSERKRGSRLGQRGIIWHTMELNKALRILAPLILIATASAATTGESGVDRGGKFGLFSPHCPQMRSGGEP